MPARLRYLTLERVRIAFVMEQTLGSVTHYLNLKAHGTAHAGVVPAWLPIDFRKGRLPWAITGSLLARRALDANAADVQACFVHTTTISLFGGGHFRKKPAVLSTDATALNKRRMRAEYGLKAETALGSGLKRSVYRRVFREAAGFVGWSSWAKASFVEDYGCPEDDVAVIPPGVDLAAFAPGERGRGLPRILFVGGDFERKGGDLLLEVFRKRLRKKAELVLVTRKELPPEPGVEVHLNVAANSERLRSLYATCDVFALPTRADAYSIVAMEALASGMPVVTTRMGGIPDIVREGETGHLIEVDDGGALGDALESLIASPARRASMGASAREDAARRFEARENARRLFDFVRSRC